jgi:type VI secretion system protein ImpK
MKMDDNDKTVFLGQGPAPSQPQEPGEKVFVSAGGQGARSAVYIAQQTSLEEYTPGLNPLVTCASLLLLEMVYLRTPGGEKLDPQGGERAAGEQGLEDLRRRLEAEVRAFENRALSSELDHSQVMGARYVLCTALDESVSTSPLGGDGAWSRQALLNTFHNETWGGEKFFQIIDRCMQQPARNLYLLELIYLLLSLGFEGRYKLQSRGPIELELLREKIYRQVRMLRGEPGNDLCRKLPEGKFRNRVYTYVPTSLLVFFVVFCLAVTFLGFSNILSNRAEPLLESFFAHAVADEGDRR